MIFNGSLDFSNFVKKVVLLRNFFVCPGRGLLPASAASAALAEQELPPLKNFRGFFWRETRNEASSVTAVAFAQVFFCRETFVSIKATSHTDQKSHESELAPEISLCFSIVFVCRKMLASSEFKARRLGLKS